MSDALTTKQSERLSQLEATIERGQQTFAEVGNALLDIRAEGLYAPHRNFHDYVSARWGWTRARAYQLMEAATVATALPENVNNCLQNEGQARELAKVEPEKRAAVVEAAVATASAEGRKLTAKDIQEAAAAPTRPEARVIEAEVVQEDPRVIRRGSIILAVRKLEGRYGEDVQPPFWEVVRAMLEQEEAK